MPQDVHLSLSLLLSSKSSGSAALLALTWTCLLVRIVFPLKAKRQGDIWNKLVGSLVFGGNVRNHIRLFTDVPKLLWVRCDSRHRMQ